MRLTIFILLLSLLGGYYLIYHCISDKDYQWYWYFLVNDLKALLLAVALMIVTFRKPSFIFACAALCITAYDVLVQALDVNQKGNWSEVVYQVLLGLMIAILSGITLGKLWMMQKNKNG